MRPHRFKISSLRNISEFCDNLAFEFRRSGCNLNTNQCFSLSILHGKDFWLRSDRCRKTSLRSTVTIFGKLQMQKLKHDLSFTSILYINKMNTLIVCTQSLNVSRFET